MKRLLKIGVVAIGLAMAVPAMASVTISPPVFHSGSRAWIVRLSTDRRLPWRAFVLTNPPRIVVDLRDAVLPGGRALWPENHGPVRDIRAFTHRNGMIRLVFDLQAPTRYQIAALPGGLTLSLPQEGRPVRAVVAPPRSVPIRAVTAPRPPPALVIAIDPGHGGIDTGACGIDHICEKNVVLRIGLDLAAMIDATPGLRAYLTRHGDYYVPLRARVEKAEAHHAAAFISIHANALPPSERMDARGAEIFILSQHGVSREARWLARSENAADRTGNLHFGTGNGFLHNILLNMTQNGTRRASYDLAADILGKLRHIESVHIDHVEKANFLVLESPTIPSVLIETAFISDPVMALRLNNPVFDRHIARAIWQGVVKDAPQLRARLGITPGPRLYVVRAGQTLSGIAARFHISIAALRAANALNGSILPVGVSLRIPATNN
ncbi:MAG: N-acetylmuramoyl-L-alanine amidase [Acidiferrobacter sp.]